MQSCHRAGSRMRDRPCVFQSPENGCCVSVGRSNPGESVVGVVGTGLMGVGVRSGVGFYDWDDVRVARVKAGRRQVISRARTRPARTR